MLPFKRFPMTCVPQGATQRPLGLPRSSNAHLNLIKGFTLAAVLISKPMGLLSASSACQCTLHVHSLRAASCWPTSDLLELA